MTKTGVGGTIGAILPERGADDVLYVIDVSGYVFRAYYALPPLSNSSGEPTHAVLGTLSMIEKVIDDRRPQWFAIALDSPGPSFRRALDVRYKATRPPAPPGLSQQMARVEQILRAWGVACFRQDGLEADDMIATVTARAVEEGWRVVVVSADKDLMQLVRDNDDRVLVWDSMRDRVFGPREVVGKFGVPPSRLGDWLALTGDSSDNIPGVAGVGPKTASELLRRFDSLDALYASLDQVERSKLRERLLAHVEDARLSRKLVTLDATAAIEWSQQSLKWRGVSGDKSELRRLYAQLELHRQVAALDAEDSGAAKGDAPRTEKDALRIDVSTRCVFDEQELVAFAARARAKGKVGISVETTREGRVGARIVGISLAVDSNEVIYVPLGHSYLGCPQLLSWEHAKPLVAALCSDRSITKVGHDLKQACVTLALAGVSTMGPVFDTLIAGYLLDPEADNGLADLARRELGGGGGPFCDEIPANRSVMRFDEVEVVKAASLAGPRAALALSIEQRLAPRLASEGLEALFRDVEMPLVGVLGDMERRGVLVDVPALGELSRYAHDKLVEIDAECRKLAGRDFSLRSRDQVEGLLFDELKLPVVKRTPKGGRSTDADVLETLAPLHPIVDLILQFRELDKLKGTYLDALPRFVDRSTGRIHTRFDQAVAATGRLSSSDPNLQNIPVRTEFGRRIRGAFVAPAGHVILSADYSQIELRILAHLAQDSELLDAFRSGGDIHTRTASLIFGKPLADVSADERRAAKTINFGVLYGMGDSALAKQLRIPREQAARFISTYFERYSGVAQFMTRTVESARQGESVRSLLGRRRFLPNLRSSNRGLRAEAERVARNTPIQGTAADILKLAMVAFADESNHNTARLVLTVHDELVFEVPEATARETGEWIRERMSSVLALDVPLVVDVGIGTNWAAAH